MKDCKWQSCDCGNYDKCKLIAKCPKPDHMTMGGGVVAKAATLKIGHKYHSFGTVITSDSH